MEQDWKEYHYYVCTGDVWVTEPDLYTALIKLRTETRLKGAYYVVVGVPLPPDAPYEINNYMPQVEGAQVIATGYFPGGKK